MSDLPVLPASPDLKNVAPVILITPDLSAYVNERADPDGSLLRAAMRHMFQNLDLDTAPGSDVAVYCVAAVVDRLPVPPGSENLASGCEGLSVLFPDKRALSASIAQRVFGRKDASASEPEPALVYETAGSPADAFDRIHVATPVANSIFLTGLPRTLVAVEWRFTHGVADPVRGEMVHLANCRIQAGSSTSTSTSTSASATSTKTNLSVSLRSLTRPKKVTASMGNVISRLAPEPGRTTTAGGTDQPASTDLEKVLPAYIAQHGLQGRKLGVWALVLDQDVDLELPTAAVETADDMANAIMRGARLHRVMGGGGGWGKKQGLLSLCHEYTSPKPAAVERPIEQLLRDPQSQTQGMEEGDLELPDELPGFLRFSGEDDSLTSLSTVAKPGDYVQFFVAPLEQTDTTICEDAVSVSENKAGSESRIFGVVPKAEDSPGYSTRDDEKMTVVAVPGHFGALSDKAVTITTFGNGDVAGTRIDVPGTRVVVGS